MEPPHTLHQLRHGGASHDAATKQRGVADIKLGGMWESEGSVKRYRKPGRVNEQVERLPPRIRDFWIRATEAMPAVLCGLSRPLPKP